MTAKAIEIDKQAIGDGFPPYVIAELSANHNGDLNRALRLDEVVKESGACAGKLQTDRPDTITLDCDRKDFLIESGPWAGRNLHELDTMPIG